MVSPMLRSMMRFWAFFWAFAALPALTALSSAIAQPASTPVPRAARAASAPQNGSHTVAPKGTRGGISVDPGDRTSDAPAHLPPSQTDDTQIIHPHLKENIAPH